MRLNLPMVAFWTFVIIAAPDKIRAYNFWDVNEIYSNADGSVQFIELTNTTANSQHQLSLTSISVSNALSVV